MEFFDRRGKAVELGPAVAHGGEAEVFQLTGRPGQVAKIYRPGKATEPRRKKLARMLVDPPVDPTVKIRHRSIAWPEELLVDASHRLAGFTMPRVDTRIFRTLVRVYHIGNYPPELTWGHLVLVARNVAATLQALHDKGYVVGDLNESNVLASENCLVTFVDCDSMQVPDPGAGRVHRCLVGRADYTPPEHQGKSFADFDREPASDLFALAVLICQLLLLGRHPFAGGPHQDLARNIQRRESFLLHGGRGAPTGTPPLRILPSELRYLFTRCFKKGHRRPGKRPTADQWKLALDEIYHGRRTCRVKPRHVYSRRLRSCPWCAFARDHGFDPFGVLPKPTRRKKPRPAPKPTPARAPAAARKKPAPVRTKKPRKKWKAPKTWWKMPWARRKGRPANRKKAPRRDRALSWTTLVLAALVALVATAAVVALGVWILLD
ncbi:MAG: protein kinase [bacterium]|nr:protein kinase [bacterium]